MLNSSTLIHCYVGSFYYQVGFGTLVVAECCFQKSSLGIYGVAVRSDSRSIGVYMFEFNSFICSVSLSFVFVSLGSSDIGQ